ncbi:hypothetical protein AaE_003102, partial [Aphanomyces astaci]
MHAFQRIQWAFSQLIPLKCALFPALFITPLLEVPRVATAHTRSPKYLRAAVSPPLLDTSMDRFAVDELDFESVEPCRPSSFDGTSSFKFDVGIRARQALEAIHLKAPTQIKDPRHMDWQFYKKVKDVKIHRLDEYTHDMHATRVSFRLSCDVKAMLESIVNVLAPTTTQEYMR